MALDTRADWESIHAAVAGDEAAWTRLYANHTPRLRAVISRIAGLDSDATEDLVQETWISAFRGLAGFRGDSTLATWLTAVAVQRAWSRLRADGRRRAMHEAIARPLAPVPRTLPHDLLDMERGIAALPATQRAVVVLHAIHGYTHREVAGMLEIDEGSSRVALARARCTLRHRMGGSSDE